MPAVEVGRIPPRPVFALANVVVGALDEAALYIARVDDQAGARDEMRVILARLIAGLSHD